MNGYRYFPKARLAIVRVPKAGCTSLTRWADAIETAIASAQPTRRNGIPLQRIADAPEGTLRIATLRHPVDRVVSAYANKILKAPSGEWIFRYLDAPWFPRLESLKEIRTAFRLFVERLVHDPNFRCSENPHWRPQCLQVADLGSFDIVLPTGRLWELPALIAAQRPDLAWVADHPMLRERTADTPLADFLLESDLVASIEGVYADDMALLRCHRIAAEFRRPVGAQPPADFDVEAELGRLRSERRAEYHSIIDRYLDGIHGPADA